MVYTEDASYFQFLIESAIETEKINGFVKSIVGVSESAKPQKLWAMHEDVGDKIRNLWDKFIAFLNRVWAKFVEFTKRVIDSEKGYLEEYKDIILNKKPEDVDLEMRDYPTGIHRMTTVLVPAFATIKDKVGVDETDITFKTELIKEYDDASKDFKGYAIAYFQGGEDKKSTNLNALNMTDLYNFCHDYDKIKTVIEKDRTTLTKTFNDANTIIQKAKADAQNPQPAATTPPPASTANPPVTANTTATPAPQVNPAAHKVGDTRTNSMGKKEKYDGKNWLLIEYTLDNYMGSYFTEEDKPTSSKMVVGTAAKPNPNAVANNNATTGNAKASSNVQSLKTSTDKMDTNVDLDHLTSQITAYNTAASAVVTAKMDSAHIIFNDYMKLIKLHVGHHVGKDGASGVAQTGTDHRSALNIKDPEAALETIAKIEDKATSANDKHKLTVELNQKIMADNPNFKGGLEAIKKAASPPPTATA